MIVSQSVITDIKAIILNAKEKAIRSSGSRAHYDVLADRTAHF